MKNLSDKLNELACQEPSDRLDKRMDALFVEAQAAPPPVWARTMPLWQCAAACLVCLVMGGLAAQVLAPVPAPQQQAMVERTIYIVPADSATMARIFDVPQRDYPLGVSDSEVIIHPPQARPEAIDAKSDI